MSPELKLLRRQHESLAGDREVLPRLELAMEGKARPRAAGAEAMRRGMPSDGLGAHGWTSPTGNTLADSFSKQAQNSWQRAAGPDRQADLSCVAAKRTA